MVAVARETRMAATDWVPAVEPADLPDKNSSCRFRRKVCRRSDFKLGRVAAAAPLVRMQMEALEVAVAIRALNWQRRTGEAVEAAADFKVLAAILETKTAPIMQVQAAGQPRPTGD